MFLNGTAVAVAITVSVVAGWGMTLGDLGGTGGANSMSSLSSLPMISSTLMLRNWSLLSFGGGWCESLSPFAAAALSWTGEWGRRWEENELSSAACASSPGPGVARLLQSPCKAIALAPCVRTGSATGGAGAELGRGSFCSSPKCWSRDDKCSSAASWGPWGCCCWWWCCGGSWCAEKVSETGETRSKLSRRARLRSSSMSAGSMLLQVVFLRCLKKKLDLTGDDAAG